MSSIFSYLCFFLIVCDSLVETMPRKFQGFNESGLDISEDDRYFMKIHKSQHKHFREYKQEKWISYFINNSVNTRSYWLNISKNIGIKHIFWSKALFHLSNTLHSSCLSLNVFNSFGIIDFVSARFCVCADF